MKVEPCSDFKKNNNKKPQKKTSLWTLNFVVCVGYTVIKNSEQEVLGLCALLSLSCRQEQKEREAGREREGLVLIQYNDVRCGAIFT